MKKVISNCCFENIDFQDSNGHGKCSSCKENCVPFKESKRLFIPELGTKLTLAEDWIFSLYPETRNESLGLLYGMYAIHVFNKEIYENIDKTLHGYLWINKQDNDNLSIGLANYQEVSKELLLSNRTSKTLLITLPTDSELTIDRIYIRKGASDYSSVSFWVKLPTNKKKIRFWAKLEDVNKIVFNEF